MNLEPFEKQASKYPKLHIVEKIAFVVLWPIGVLYIFYCFCLYLGMKPWSDDEEYQEFKHPISPYTYRYDASNPYAYTPGSYLWRSTHRS